MSYYIPDDSGLYAPAPGQPTGGPIYLSRSAPGTPYGHQPGLYSTTPPVHISPLPQVIYPYQVTPRVVAAPLPVAPVLIDVLNSGQNAHWSQRPPPHIRYDIRDYPEKAVIVDGRNASPISNAHLRAHATSDQAPAIKIISKLFPWEIDVKNPRGVTVLDVLNSIHETLNAQLTNSEWWIVEERVRDAVGAAWKRNYSGKGYDKPRAKEQGVKRVDWLLDQVFMHGLERDDEFIATRIRDKDARAITWVLVTSK